MQRPSRRRVAMPLVLLAGGCVASLSEVHVAPADLQRHLPAIVVGDTPVATLERAFGPPTARFEQGRLRCWALMLVEKDLAIDVDDHGVMRPQPPVVADSGTARSARRAALAAAGSLRAVSPTDHAARALWPVWREVECHLTAVVDAEGRVERWSFVRVLP